MHMLVREHGGIISGTTQLSEPAQYFAERFAARVTVTESPCMSWDTLGQYVKYVKYVKYVNMSKTSITKVK